MMSSVLSENASHRSSQPSRLHYRKIFGIGLSRTGTKSLHVALGILGFRSIHYPQLDRMEQLLHWYDAAVDTPVACSFRELDGCYPDSRFILTVRDFRAWLKSAEWHFSGPSPDAHWKREVRLRTYGTLTWDRSAFLKAYHHHVLTVVDYFENRSEALLIIDITGGEGWEPLCAFLQRPVPAVEFPHENARSVP
jgi:hypothetical protein